MKGAAIRPHPAEPMAGPRQERPRYYVVLNAYADVHGPVALKYAVTLQPPNRVGDELVIGPSAAVSDLSPSFWRVDSAHRNLEINPWFEIAHRAPFRISLQSLVDPGGSLVVLMQSQTAPR